MLSNIIESDTKALVEVFIGKKLRRPVNGDKEKYKNYLADLVSRDKEIVLNDITMSALCYAYESDPSTLPILLRYFTHKNLLQEAKGDLDKISQKLQSEMDEDLKDLQDEKTKLQKGKANLNNIQMYSEETKRLAIKNELIKLMKKKPTAYVEDNKADIEKIYQCSNSRAKKIIMLRDLQRGLQMVASIPFFVTVVLAAVVTTAENANNTYRRAGFVVSPSSMYGAYIVIGVSASVAAILLAIAGVAHLTSCHLKHSSAKEMQNFIEGPKHVDKATNTENVEESKRQEEKWKGEDLIDLSCNNDECNNQVTPSAPPFEEEVKVPRLYPNLEEYLYSLSSVSSTPFNTPQQRGGK